MSISPTTPLPSPRAVADSEAKFGNRPSVTPPTLLHSDSVFSVLSPFVPSCDSVFLQLPFWISALTIFSMYPKFLIHSTLTFHSLLGFDLSSTHTPPPPIAQLLWNASQECLEGGGVLWEGDMVGGHCCCSIKHDGRGSRNLIASSHTSRASFCALITPSSLLNSSSLTLLELCGCPLRTSLAWE